MYNYLGLTDDRLKHMRQVGERCIEIASKLSKHSLTVNEQQKYFMIGFLHDIGYRFSTIQTEHNAIGAQMLHDVGVVNSVLIPISEHGKPKPLNINKDIVILNIADMTTSSDGQKVTFDERMAGIEKRYGKNSKQYIEAVEVWKNSEKWIKENTNISNISLI